MKKIIYRIKNFHLKGFLKKRARKIIRYLSKRFEIPIVELKGGHLNHLNSVKEDGITLKLLRKELFCFERNYPVNRLKINEVYVYPFLRNWLIAYINSYAVHNVVLGNPNCLLAGTTRDVPYRTRQLIKDRLGALEIEEVESNNIDILVVNNIESSENIYRGNKIFQRFSDTFMEIFSKIGVKKLMKISHIRHSNIDLFAEDFYYPYQLLVMFPYVIKRGYSSQMEFPYQLDSVIRTTMPHIKIDYKIISEILEWDLFLMEWYMQLLMKLQPKLVVIVHWSTNAPLIAAAHKLNIKTVTLQEGELVADAQQYKEGTATPLFNGYQFFMPQGGYEALPDYFLMRTKKDLQHINKVFIGSKHKSVLVGNIWLNGQRQFLDNNSGFLDEKYVRLIRGYKKVVLVPLNGLNELYSIIKDIVKNSPDDILFIVRHHQGVKSRVTVDDFQKENCANILIGKEIDECLLGELFNFIHYTISDGSAVAKEAVEWGREITSFVFNEETTRHFKQEIEEGNIVFIKDYKDFFEHLEKGTQSKPFEESKIDTEKAIKQFLIDEIGMDL